MRNIFSALIRQRTRRQAALALGLLAGTASPAFAQIPSTIYVLGKVITSNAPYLFEVNPANLATASNTDLPVANSLHAITGLNSLDQPLVAIDVRPRTGQIYALGYRASDQSAQLYILDPATYALTPVGSGLTLNLQDTNTGAANGNTGNTLGQTVNVGFDFNPRADLIRIIGPNGTSYRLNPNTGTAPTQDNGPLSTANLTLTPLVYTAPAYAQRTPYIGTAAYTNSLPGLAGTTLYDVDLGNSSGLLARQNPPNAGTLDQAAPLRFTTHDANGTYAADAVLASPTYRLDLDITYDRANSINHYYLLEARARTSAAGYTTNLYEITQGQVNNVATNTNVVAMGENITAGNTLAFYDIAAFTGIPKTWTGQVSSAWNDAGNWYPTGIPGTADDLFIAGNGTFVSAVNYTIVRQPVVPSAATAGQQNAGSITLENSALLTLADGSILNDFGGFVNNGGQVAAGSASTGALVLASTGNVPQDIGGTTATTFPNLQVLTTGATTSAAVAIQRSLTVSGTLAIGSNQSFTLLSSSSGTAYLVNSGSGTVTGTATVQRYITPTNAGLGYRHYSAPVGTTVADLATSGFTPVVNSAYNSAANPRQVRPYPTVFTYNQARLATSNASYAVGDFDNGFLSPDNTGSTLTVGRGYSVNIGGTQLVDFQGALNQNANYPVTGLARGAQTTAGYQFLGNPYPGAIDYNTVITNSTGMESALYVYKSTGQYAGSYTTYVPATTGTNGGPSVSANGGTSNIPVAQGFFMRTAAGQTGSVTFTTTARTNAPETATFNRTTVDSRAMLALTVRNAAIANQMRVYFDQSATPGFDAQYDAHYLPATHGLDIASDIGTEALAINGLPELTGVVAVPLQLHAAAAGTYTLAVDELANLPAGYHAYLRDGSTSSYTDLAAVPSLSLTLAPGDAATGRYAVVFATSQPLASAPAALAALVGIYPNPAHGTATLVLPQALRGQASSEVTLVNTLGQVVLRRTVAAGTSELVELPLGSLAAGIYTVRAITTTGTVAKQLRVE